MTDPTAADRAELEVMVEAFFRSFTSGEGTAERLDVLRKLFLPEAVIVRTCGDEPAVYSVEEFIAPRQELLEGGTLVSFSEWPVNGRIDIFGDIAHWWGSYAKEGVQNGEAFTGRGMKSMQFIRTLDGWRISAAAWDDARPGLRL
ncbi:DUF4440 domain-containing protein [Kribbella sp. CA-293567]|uniref:DUF4440 domain-containing protein n=1 Tax=Kribbella sp. CA-293567 TaxID=3002436 RepID=UPI0022DDDB27|nr:DUF4440 domain-containing protein [Kribbella sp. CA-293567]WBQ06836.1 DUF4440 domain-containing protein [Kribbella sp. CA-293567]